MGSHLPPIHRDRGELLEECAESGQKRVMHGLALAHIQTRAHQHGRARGEELDRRGWGRRRGTAAPPPRHCLHLDITTLITPAGLKPKTIMYHYVINDSKIVTFQYKCSRIVKNLVSNLSYLYLCLPQRGNDLVSYYICI